MSVKQFPEEFLWGSATASYQVEGGIENVDWAEAARKGKVPVCGRACDHYNRYESDFDIAKELGHNCHRISIEWARIEPEEGKFNEQEIEHYRAVLAALRERRLKPFITLWHFTLPQWFADKGGFENPHSPQIFARYCAYVTQKLGNDCRHFATMNEPTVYASNGWVRGTWPPFKEWPGMGYALKGVPGQRDEGHARIGNIFLYYRVLNNLAKAHNAAYKAMKAVEFGAEIGVVHQVLLFHADGNPFNALLATYEKTDMGWDVYPEGITDALLLLKRYDKPLWVSEAGIADATDRIRADYITRLIHGTKDAMEEGADVRGFMYWSLLDNYEWAQGFEKRFGLVEIDYATLARKIRPSAYVYKGIIERNGLIN